MTIPNRLLDRAIARSRHSKKRRLSKGFWQGVADITLMPTMPNIRLGANSDDWKMVGDDIRLAMKQIETCE